MIKKIALKQLALATTPILEQTHICFDIVAKIFWQEKVN